MGALSHVSIASECMASTSSDFLQKNLVAEFGKAAMVFDLVVFTT